MSERDVTSTDGSLNLDVHASDDKMSLLVSCTVEFSKCDSIAKAIDQKLSELNVKDPPNYDRILNWLDQQAKGRPEIIDGILLKGKPPIPPIDGEIKWAQDFFSTGFAVDEETGKIDYRQHIAQVTVEDGQLLATIIPPKAGESGYDVFGNRVAPEIPDIPCIVAGENVLEDKDAAAFYATADGRIRWSEGLLAVDTLYEIDGSVGLDTGNVSHPGAVVVNKDVLDGSKLEALGDVEVMGVVEAAQLQTGGNLVVHGGIVGSENQNLLVAGSVHAKFIMDAHIQAGGDIIVEKEILNSILLTRGAVIMPKGRLAGGETTALAGISVGQTSTSAGVPTILTVGKDYSLEGKILVKQKDIETIKRQLEKIKVTLAPFMVTGAKIPDDKREAIKKLVAKSSEMKEKLDEMRNEVEKIQAESEKQAKYGIEALHSFYPNTTIHAKNASLTIKEEHTGPVKAIYKSGEIKMHHT